MFVGNNGNFPILGFGDCFGNSVKGKQIGIIKQVYILVFSKKLMRKLMNKWVLYIAFIHDLKEIIGHFVI